MSRIIALASKRNVNLVAIATELRKRFQCSIVDTLHPSYITHCNIKTSVVQIDPRSGPYNTCFTSFKRGVSESRYCVDAMLRMIALHKSNTELIGLKWTEKSIPPIPSSQYVVILGLYTQQDIDRVVFLGGSIVFIDDEYAKTIPVIDDCLEEVIMSSSNLSTVVSYYDKDIMSKISSVMTVV